MSDPMHLLDQLKYFGNQQFIGDNLEGAFYGWREGWRGFILGSVFPIKQTRSLAGSATVDFVQAHVN